MRVCMRVEQKLLFQERLWAGCGWKSEDLKLIDHNTKEKDHCVLSFELIKNHTRPLWIFYGHIVHFVETILNSLSLENVSHLSFSHEKIKRPCHCMLCLADLPNTSSPCALRKHLSGGFFFFSFSGAVKWVSWDSNVRQLVCVAAACLVPSPHGQCYALNVEYDKIWRSALSVYGRWADSTHKFSLSSHTQTHTHARTHARMHTHAHMHTHTHTVFELFLLLCIFEISTSSKQQCGGGGGGSWWSRWDCAAELLIKPVKYWLSFTFTPKHVIWD